ncbi:DNA topoisomerase [Lentinula raphanica]|uniref:DNA topoisomerase (ATP-hydrolyzing) n=1 Tax=Lentinula raphanica TaxID=153919 RepID=A0AA38UIZ3_9AGAR|nr:DNA topoisomerase [Lentinula raphanica]
MDKEEFQIFEKVMDLQYDKEYSDVSRLRYGRLMIITDQDDDGLARLKGVFINFIGHLYPSLFKIPDSLVGFMPPIIRVTTGEQCHDFFTIFEYEQWTRDVLPGAPERDTKYFKVCDVCIALFSVVSTSLRARVWTSMLVNTLAIWLHMAASLALLL